jgi:hypothetical protein
MPHTPVQAAPTRRAVMALAAAASAAGLGQALAARNLFEAADELHVIADPRTGCALYGYDAVAYHLDQAALLGSAEHEAQLDGRLWRFRSAASKAAFEQDPAAYMPLFGGHDAAAVAAGAMVEGDPAIFALVGGRLALFRDEDGRSRFVADAELRRTAVRAWPMVVRQQAGH